FFVQAEDGIRDRNVTGVQTCALPICRAVDGPIAERDVAGLVAVVLLVVVVGFGESIAQLVRRTLTAGMTADWEVLWRRRLFTHRSEERRVGKEGGQGGTREAVWTGTK